ncbi:MAG: L-ribulose-5-phosphate 4-epimerase AraD [Bacteroidales bacterium]|nr:L-ribulose-5-phosphate 4-epimerase AraD [Bacteroidales bacterium]
MEELKRQVLEANLELVRQGLVFYTWGNASGFDKSSGLMVIKPSGVSYEKLTVDDLVVLDLDGKVVGGRLKPSSDTATHIELYKAFPDIGGVVHTHSTYATAWAQAGKDIPSLGTTHADYFHGGIPCTDDLSPEQIAGEYEKETGTAIIRRFSGLDPIHTPAVLVKNHGPFTWGKNPAEAAYHAKVLEEVAKMALLTYRINPDATGNPLVEERHFLRKHGPNASYGQ